MGAGLLAAIATLATPILSRILVALGLSVVTVAGASAVIAALRSTLMSYLGAAPVAGLQVAGLAGVWQGLGMIFGAITFIMSLYAMTKVVRVVSGT